MIKVRTRTPTRTQMRAQVPSYMLGHFLFPALLNSCAMMGPFITRWHRTSPPSRGCRGLHQSLTGRYSRGSEPTPSWLGINHCRPHYLSAPPASVTVILQPCCMRVGSMLKEKFNISGEYAFLPRVRRLIPLSCISIRYVCWLQPGDRKLGTSANLRFCLFNPYKNWNV